MEKTKILTNYDIFWNENPNFIFKPRQHGFVLNNVFVKPYYTRSKCACNFQAFEQTSASRPINIMKFVKHSYFQHKTVHTDNKIKFLSLKVYTLYQRTCPFYRYDP